ncbi:MAG TPA: hypothetical protein PLF42_14425 [Anaerolineales bacterium]|nr:hypothetical protein [Anaerolineales bacterium]
MKFKKHFFITNMLLASLMLAACAPQAEPAESVDAVGTLSAELAAIMLTQTAIAYTPTALPPTETPEPAATELPTLPPEPVETSMPIVYGSMGGKEPCYKGGPGPNREVTSYITDTKIVELLGIGSVEGWYVIRDPYFYSPCWIRAENLKLESDFDLSDYPVISP